MSNKTLILSIILLLNISNFVLGDIEICLELGGKCSVTNQLPDYYFYDYPDGTFCYNNIVTQYAKVGENCSLLECDDSYSRCYDSICVVFPYAAVGEFCSDDGQCVSNLCQNSLCVSAQSDCKGNDINCKSSEFCGIDTCMPRAKKGESCKFNKCSIDTACSPADICVGLFTTNEGGECNSNLECQYSKGQACVDSECAKPKLENVDNCTTEAVTCNENFQYCSFNTFKCTTDLFINSECQNLQSNYLSCQIKNSCHQKLPGDDMAPEGCVMKNCRYEYCQITQKCDISYCGINYNAFLCDGVKPPKQEESSEDSSEANILNISKFLLLFILVLLF